MTDLLGSWDEGQTLAEQPEALEPTVRNKSPWFICWYTDQFQGRCAHCRPDDALSNGDTKILIARTSSLKTH